MKLLIFCFFVHFLSVSSFQTLSNSTARIVGGLPARAGQFPFLAATCIYITRPDGNYFCSGALINFRWILTAGQCVNGATLLTIHLGSNTLDSSDPNSVVVATETYFVHPDFDPLTLQNDVGLIKLRSSVTLTNYIKSIGVYEHTNLPDNSIVVTMGWGQISDSTGGLVDHANFVYLTSISNEVCKLIYGSQITDSMVCAAGSFNEGTCLGDSGSPLVQFSASNNGHAYHVGISSFYSGNGCESPDPSGFTRTQPYYNWISSTIEYSP